MRFKQPFFQSSLLNWLIFLASGVAYFLLGYAAPRSGFNQLIFFFSVAFAGYFFLINSSLKLRYLLGAALGFRLLLLFSIPALSDDYFRFVWDGRLLIQGENPYQKLPSEYITNPTGKAFSGINKSLFENLNSPDYYSVYPPVCQGIFAIAAYIFPDSLPGSIIIMRLFLLLAEALCCWLLYRILLHLNLPTNHVLWYALNPLVIVELTGNLHFEALMICFWLAAFWFLLLKKPVVSAIFLGLAVGVKLLPLIFIPFLIRPLGLKKAVLYGFVTITVFSVLFLPFITSALIGNIGSSVGLYFQKFEFNASVYYLLRELGFIISGYNQIAVIGKVLLLVTFAAIMYQALRKSNQNLANIPANILMGLTFYFLMATTVHPWYLTTLVAFAVFTKWRFVMVWSALILLSYATYQTSAYQENLKLVAMEYLLVIGFLIFEIYQQKTRQVLVPGRV